MNTLLREVQLRNRRRILREDDSFIVVQIDSKGTEHSSTYPKAAIDKLYGLTRSETVTKEDAANRLRPFALQLGLPYHYGWRLNFLVLDLLAVLVATDLATTTKE